MKEKATKLLKKYGKPLLSALMVVAILAAYIVACELYQYLALNVW